MRREILTLVGQIYYAQDPPPQEEISKNLGGLQTTSH